MGAARLLWLAALALLMTAPARAQSDGLPTEPMLRINAPGHIAQVIRIATDAAERFAVTASDDKTVRVWSLPDGTLQRVIWLPSAEGNLGKAYAVALSPDGGTIAVGGWTSLTGLDTNVYLFDRASGALVRRLSGLQNVVNHLAFSPDGRRLAAALGGGNGIRVYDAADGYLPLPSDGDYADSSLWLDFDRAGRLVSASFDGFVRLYAADRYDRPAVPKAKVPGIGRPLSVAFAPDGKQVAVGNTDSATVAVLRDRDLQPETFPGVASLDASQIRIAWSRDGGQLFAGGYPTGSIWRWDKADAVSFIAIARARDTVMQFVPLRGRRMLFADAAGFGLIDPAGKATRLHEQGTVDTRYATTGLRISADARTAQITDHASGRVLRFALARRTVAVDPAEDKTLAGAVTGSARVKITDWEHNVSPKLNGEKLVLKQDEISRSVALVPRTDQLVLGADWSLRLFDAGGGAVWREPRPVPAAVWGVNVSGDGRLIVAAYGDGTIRWHRVSDGAELLALFMHPDGKRWVAWTPQGYYDASAGADNLIGWQVNHGHDQAPDFFPAAQFQERFNRREVIARVLDTLDVDQAVEQANIAAGRKGAKAAPLAIAGLTPVVEIRDPAPISDQSNREFALTYLARLTNSAPIQRVEARIDGVLVEAKDIELLAEPDKRLGSLRFTLPQRDAKISVIAYNTNGPSAPASIEVHWKGPGRDDKATLYVLAIGVTNYQNKGLPEVRFPAKDAHDFVALAKRQQGGRLYGRVVTWPKFESLVNAQATRENILDGLDWIKSAVASSSDVAMIFVSGHGVNTPDQHYRFLPHDYDPNRIERTTIADIEFQQYIEKIHGKTLFFFDTCFSGNVLGGKATATTPDVDKFANQLRTAKNGVVVFASSTGDELSWEPPRTRDPSIENGAFTWALLDGLSGKAARPGVEVITLTDLNSHVAQTVPHLTFGNQHPTFAMPKTVQDYPIISVIR